MEEENENSIDSLEQNFFAVIDEFPSVSSIDPSTFTHSSAEKWMDDSVSNNCMLCGAEFTHFNRRHHCRHCGLLMCGKCTSNRTIGNSIDRICDACASILVPPSPDTQYTSLDEWQSKNEQIEIQKLKPSSKNVGFAFLYSMLDSDCHPAHFNTVRTLYRLFPMYSPVMVQSALPKVLHHALHCDCSVQYLSLDLFVSLFNLSSNTFDIPNDLITQETLSSLIHSDSIISQRTTSRLLYSLQTKSTLPPFYNFLNTDDKWVTSFLLAAISTQVHINDINTLLDEGISKHSFYSNAKELIPLLLNNLNPKTKSSTLSARYYSSAILEKLSHYVDDAMLIMQSDLNNLVKLICTCCPTDENDERNEIDISIYLISCLLNIWRNFNEAQSGDKSCFLSQVFMTIFEVLNIKNIKFNNKKLQILQLICLEMIEIIISFSDLKPMLCGQQTLCLLEDLTKGNSPFNKKALKLFESLKNCFDSLSSN